MSDFFSSSQKAQNFKQKCKNFTYKNTIDYTIKRKNMTNKIKDTTFYKNVYVHLTN